MRLITVCDSLHYWGRSERFKFTHGRHSKILTTIGIFLIEELSLSQAAIRQAEICRIFSNPIRIQILWALSQRTMPVGEIAETIQCSLQNTSHHLRLMKDTGFLTSKRVGRTVEYRLTNPELVSCLLNPNKSETGNPS